MKIAIIGINNSLIDLSSQNEVIDFLKFNIIKQGKMPSLVSYFNNNLDNIRLIINQNYDLVFFVGSDSIIFNHNIKDNLAKIFGVRLEKYNPCEMAIQDYCANNNIVYSAEEEMQTFFPTNSQPIYKTSYFNNGFAYKYNNTQVFMLPSDVDFVSEVYSFSILPFLSKNSGTNASFNTMTIRCYGILEKDLRGLIQEELKCPNIIVDIVSTRLDNVLYISYQNTDISAIQPVIADICSKLSKLIYATEDTTLYQTAVNLLSIQKKKIVLAETLTKANITSNIMNLNADVIEKSIIVSNFDSIAKQLKLSERVVNQFGKYSVNTVYELDNLLLEQANSDIAIFVLGDKTNNTCFIAIGDIDGIHVYKNKFMTYNQLTINMLSETTMFYLIKKLRQNDLQFR